MKISKNRNRARCVRRLSGISPAIRLSLAAAATLFGLSSVSWGQYTWANSGTGDWFTGANWSSGAIPTSAIDAQIHNGGTAQILSGSAVATQVFVGTNIGTTGALLVGGGSLTASSAFNVGHRGTGTMGITGGGVVSSASGRIGTFAGATGNVTVDGAGSQWNMSGFFQVGSSGNGTLEITAGGVVSNTVGTISVQSTSIAKVTVDGVGSQWNNSNSLGVGSSGSGTLEITAGGLVTVGVGGVGGITLGAGVNGKGVLSIGTGGTAGTLSAAVVTTGAGTGEVIFNHTDNITFAPQLTGTLKVTKLGAGTTTLTGTNAYSGGTTIGAGTLSISQDGNLGAATGGITFTGGTLQATATFTLASTRATTLTGNGAFDVTANNTLTYGGVIDGAGALTKLGLGTLSLQQANTYLGGTVLTAGTLLVGNNLALGTGDVTMNGGTLAGTGSTTLANNFKIAATAVFNPGTGAINDLTLNGNVDLQGAGRTLSMVANGFAGVTLNGVISNDGGGGVVFAKSSGSGLPLFTLGGTGSNTYTGTTEVNSGVALTLSKTGGAIAIPAALLVHDGATVTTTQNEQIADTAAVQVDGTGVLNIGSGGSSTETIGSLLGDGQVSIGTSTYGSVLRIGSGDFSGSITGGTGGQPRVEKYGPGTLVLSGTNSYSGNLTIFGGIVSVGTAANVGAGGLSLEGGELLNTGTLVWNKPVNLFNTGGGTLASAPGTTATISGKIDGLAGNALHIGDAVNTGTVIFSGNNNTYAGATEIDGGTLLVQNTSGSATGTGAVHVNTGGTLGGTGFIAGAVTNSGLVSPGNSPGTLTFSSNYTQTGSGTLRIEVGGRHPGQHDLLTVGGAATLGGTLQLVRLNKFQLNRGDRIVFLTAAGGVTGVFSTLQNEFGTGTTISGQVVYSAKDVALVAVQESFVTVPDLIKEQYPDLAREISYLRDLSPNQLAVAQALDALVKRHGGSKLIDYLNHRPLPELPGDFDRIAPDELTAIYRTAVSLATIQSLNLQRRTDDLRSGANGFSAQGLAINGQTPSYSGNFLSGSAGPTGDRSKDSKVVSTPAPDNRWGVFLSGNGDWIDVDGDGNARGYDITTGGFTLGVDYKVAPSFAIGISAGYAGTAADLTNDGRVWVNGGKLGVYATYFTGGFYTDVAVNGGYNSYETKRGGLEGAARGSTDGGELNVLFGTGYDLTVGALKIGPTATFNYTYVGFGDFTERGSLAPLSFPEQSGESLRTAFGFKASYDWKIGGVIVKPELRAAWQHEYADNDFAIDSKFANGAGNVLSVRGPQIGRDSLLLGGGVAVQFSARTSAYLYYDSQIARENYDSHSLTGGLRVAF